MDDRARLARFGGERRDVAMAERMRRFCAALAGRLRREFPAARAAVGEGEGGVTLTFRFEPESGPRFDARLAYDGAAFEADVSVAGKEAIDPDFEHLLTCIGDRYPELPLMVERTGAGAAARLRAGPAAGVEPSELAFLLVRDLGRALPSLVRAAGQ